MKVTYHGGPADGRTEDRDLPDLDSTTTLDERYLLSQVACGHAHFDWQHEHTGRRTVPDEPCCTPPRPSCPHYPRLAH